MKYMPLWKIYYVSPDTYEQVYAERFYACTTKHFPISVKEVNRKQAYPSFLCQMPICSRDRNILKDIFDLFASTSDPLDLIGGLYLFD